MIDLPAPLAADAVELIAHWERVWAADGLAAHVDVEISERMHRSAGRCLPERGTVRIASHVVTQGRTAFVEVLCHEAAHVAVYLLHGRAARAHGPEWRALVTAAGFTPRTSIVNPCTKYTERHRDVRRAKWSHRCPVCQTTRISPRPVRRWRCRECVEAGLDGKMEINRIAPSGPDAP